MFCTETLAGTSSRLRSLRVAVTTTVSGPAADTARSCATLGKLSTIENAASADAAAGIRRMKFIDKPELKPTVNPPIHQGIGELREQPVNSGERSDDGRAATEVESPDGR